MRCSGLALSRGTVPPIAQRPLRRSTAYRGRNLNRRSGCPDHQRLRSSPCRVGQSFLIADGPGLPPRRRRKVPLRRWLRVPPLAGGPRFPLRRVARGFLAPKARDLPLPGGSRSPQAGGPRFPVAGGSGPPQARGPEVPRCRVAPDSSGPEGPQIPVAGWLRVPPGRWPKVSRCRVAPDSSGPEGPQIPVAGWLGAGPSPVAQSFLCADGSGFPLRPRARGNPIAGWLQKALLPVARGPSFAGWLRGFPLCLWLRVSPSPATVPGGEEISTPVRTGRTRGLHQQFQDSLAVHKPSTVNPGLSPVTVVSPPNTPQRGPQAGLAGEPG